MKKIENCFYQGISSYFKKQNFSRINKLIKDNLWLTPLIYIIGTIALLIRNKMLGLQFTSISFIQFALIVVYLAIFLFMYSLIEFNLISLFDLIYKKDKDKIIKIIGYIILYIIYLVLVFNFIDILIDNFTITIELTTSYFILYPIFVIFFEQYR